MQSDCKFARKLRRWTKKNKRERERERKEKREKESCHVEATGPLIISIIYANLRGETGLEMLFEVIISHLQRDCY